MPRRSVLRLTKRIVDAMNVETGNAVFWDRDLAGFGVRVHATGRKVYVVQSRGPGGPRRVTLGRHGEVSADEARKRAAVIIDRIKRGEEPVPAPPEAELTVAELVERFMRVHVSVHCKLSTAAAYRSVLEKHILPALGTIALSEVGGQEVSVLHHGLRETPWAANMVIDLLSEMFTLAEAWELMPPGNNPCHSVRRYRTRPRERFLTPEECRRLGRALKDAEGAVWAPAIAAIKLLILTGCRKSEILNLRWDDVDRTAGNLRLRDAKAGPRMVPLTEPVLSVLEGIPRQPDNPRVIPGQRRGRGLSSLNYYLELIRERAGLDDVRIHDLRHSYASRALALGESLPTIGRLLGHRKVETTARYVHLIRDAEKLAAARVGESISAHIKPRSTEAA